MKLVGKFELGFIENQILELREGSQIVRVDVVEGKAYLWALIDTELPLMKRYIEMYKTGQEIKTYIPQLTYLGNLKYYVGQEICLYVFENTQKNIFTI